MKIRSSGSQVVPCGGMKRQTDGQIDMTKPIFAFSNFANVPKNEPKTTIHKIHGPDILSF